MQNAPTVDIDPAAFWRDPYPALAQMRRDAPVAHVPQVGAILFTRRDDIIVSEKKIDVFSSDQSAGLMTVLMGQNMMRKDGAAMRAEAVDRPGVRAPAAYKRHLVRHLPAANMIPPSLPYFSKWSCRGTTS